MDGEPSACDVVMNDDDDNEDKQPTSARVSHQEVWAVFESIWSNVYQARWVFLLSDCWDSTRNYAAWIYSNNCVSMSRIRLQEGRSRAEIKISLF